MLIKAGIGIAVLVLGGCAAEVESSATSGYFETIHVAKVLKFYDDISSAELGAFIDKRRPKGSQPVGNDELAQMIHRVSSCFGLDQRIFASQLAQESAFVVAAASPTGAAGLSQMTTIGIAEVNDQLGQRGALYARQSATAYFRGTIFACVDAAGVWVDPWTLSTDSRAIKDMLKREPVTALVYGAILMKTLLSSEVTKHAGANVDDIYRGALGRYNGDPSERDHYQSVIMDAAAGQF